MKSYFSTSITSPISRLRCDFHPENVFIHWQTRSAFTFRENWTEPIICFEKKIWKNRKCNFIATRTNAILNRDERANDREKVIIETWKITELNWASHTHREYFEREVNRKQSFWFVSANPFVYFCFSISMCVRSFSLSLLFFVLGCEYQNDVGERREKNGCTENMRILWFGAQFFRSLEYIIALCIRLNAAKEADKKKSNCENVLSIIHFSPRLPNTLTRIAHIYARTHAKINTKNGVRQRIQIECYGKKIYARRDSKLTRSQIIFSCRGFCFFFLFSEAISLDPSCSLPKCLQFGFFVRHTSCRAQILARTHTHTHMTWTQPMSKRLFHSASLSFELPMVFR